MPPCRRRAAPCRRRAAPGHPTTLTRGGPDRPLPLPRPQFRTSLLARRFPALRNLKDEEVALVVAQTMGRGPGDGGRDAAGPGGYASEYGLSVGGDMFGASTRKARKLTSKEKRGGKAPFSPCNPSKARETIARKGKEMFIMSTDPYGADKESFLTSKNVDERKRMAEPFAPNSASQAKDSIQTGFFMNSPEKGTEYLLSQLEATSLTTKSLQRAVYGLSVRSGGTSSGPLTDSLMTSLGKSHDQSA